MPQWMNFGITGQCDWPDRQVEVTFGNYRFVLMPCTKENSASIHIETHSADGLSEMTAINRFLSVISWSYKGSLEADEYGSVGRILGPAIVTDLVQPIDPCFLIRWNPLPGSKQRLAVALYREALSVNSPPYQFLGFFKIINILYKSGLEQVQWIRATLPKLNYIPAQERLATLQHSQPDIAQYLYESGRCAVAHAFVDPLVDPDDTTDLRRLSADLDVIRALAEHLIEHELHVPRYP